MKRIFLRPSFGKKLIDTNSAKFSSVSGDSQTSPPDDVKPDGWYEAKPYSSIPGPKGLPIIGNIWRYLPVIGHLRGKDFNYLSKMLYEKYGNIARLGGIPANDIVMIFSPEDIEYLFRNEGKYPIRESTTKTFAYYRKNIRNDVFKGATGVSEVHGKEWYDVRSIANPILMRPQTVLQYVGVMDTIAQQLVEKMRYSANLNSLREMPEDFINDVYAWALESVLSVALNKQLGCLKPNLPEDSEAVKIIQSSLELFPLFFKLERGFFIRNMYKSKEWKRYVELMDYLTFTFLKYMEESIEKANNNKEQPNQQATIFQQLLQRGEGTSIAIALDLLTGGVDTTGKVMGSALYYLAKSPKAQDTLREELRRLLPNKDSPITNEVLSETSYLKAVFKEVTRLAPIGAANMRRTVKDLVLSGYQIPKGTSVVTANLFLSLSDKYYVRAKEFIPERWLRTTTGDLSVKSSNPFITMPFGYGPRSCIGKRVATLELEVAIAKVIRNFHLEWHYKDVTFKGTPFYGVADPLKVRAIEVPN